MEVFMNYDYPLPMYRSTRDPQGQFVSFSEAMLLGQAPDGGLFVPDEFFHLTKTELEQMSTLSYQELAFKLLHPYLHDIEASVLKTCIERAYSSFAYDQITPTIQLGNSNQYVLELWHGPTAAFKDVALQLMGHLFAHVLDRSELPKNERRKTILTATSGDTGGAALAAFAGREHCNIVVLFPDQGTSEVQRRQMASFDIHQNAHVLAVRGDFDQAQSIVKELQLDPQIREALSLSSANSINIARLLPQMVYYFASYFQLKQKRPNLGAVNFVVPSANMGDALAGYIAKKLGLPIGKIIVATNVNDSLTRFFQTGIFQPANTLVPTDTCSMDILYPNNLERLLFFQLGAKKTEELMQDYHEQGKYEVDHPTLQHLQQTMWAGKAIPEQAHQAMQVVQANYGTVLDPHTAVGWHVGQQYQQASHDSNPIVYLATAHPAKFPASVQQALNQESPHLASIDQLEQTSREVTTLNANFEEVRDYLLQTIG